MEPFAKRTVLGLKIAALGAMTVVAFAVLTPGATNTVATSDRAVPTPTEPAAASTTQPRVTTTKASTTTRPTTTVPTTMPPMAHDHSAPPDTSPPVAAATTPTTATTVIHGGSTSAGVYCNGWITRVGAPSHFYVYDTTGRAPTPADCAAAHAFYDRAKAWIAKYSDLNAALADNFKPGGDPPGQYDQHYVHWKKIPAVADPNDPEGLMYHFDANGKPHLLGMYFAEKEGVALPQPAGPLTLWHSHTPTAMRMLHVWTFAGARDPFALMAGGAL